MTDGGYNREIRIIYRPCDNLLVESPQVLEASAAPGEYQDIYIFYPVQIVYRFGDLPGRAFALHFHRIYEDPDIIETAPQYMQYVADNGAGRRCHDTDLRGEHRDRPLVGLVEEAFLLKPFLKLLESELKLTHPFRLGLLHIKLRLSCLIVETDPPKAQDFQAVLYLEFYALVRAPEERAIKDRLSVLKGEVHMA